MLTMLKGCHSQAPVMMQVKLEAMWRSMMASPSQQSGMLATWSLTLRQKERTIFFHIGFMGRFYSSNAKRRTLEFSTCTDVPVWWKYQLRTERKLFGCKPVGLYQGSKLSFVCDTFRISQNSGSW